MNEKEIKDKYYEYKRRGYIRPPELITDDDWDNYYRNLAFGIEPSIFEMKQAIKRADFLIKKRDEAIKRRKENGEELYLIEF